MLNYVKIYYFFLKFYLNMMDLKYGEEFIEINI